jgi:hypothetical protein
MKDEESRQRKYDQVEKRWKDLTATANRGCKDSDKLLTKQIRLNLATLL